MIDNSKKEYYYTYLNQLKKYFINLTYQILFLEQELQRNNINDISLKTTIKSVNNIINNYLKKISFLLQDKDENYFYENEYIEQDAIEIMLINLDNIQNLLDKNFYKAIRSSMPDDIINIKLMIIFIKKKLSEQSEHGKYYKEYNMSVKNTLTNQNLEKEKDYMDVITLNNLDSKNSTKLPQISENKLKKIDIKEKNGNLVNKIILNILLITSLLGVSVSIFNIFIHEYNSIKTNELSNNISSYVTIDKTSQEEGYNVDLGKIKEINSDTVAWLKVNGTTIEYPVVKYNDNDFYLSHSFDKKYNKAGWIFADFRNTFDGNDDNIIIYGHNMLDGSMFNTLKKVIKSEWYENEDNHLIFLLTENQQIKYKVFSTYKISAKDYETVTKYESKEDFKTYLNIIKHKSIFNYKVDVNENDQILTLSTCDDNSNYRIVLHAKKVS